MKQTNAKNFFLFFEGLKAPVCNFQSDLLALSAIENTYLCFELEDDDEGEVFSAQCFH